MYSGCPKTGRPVWQTGHKSVRISACPVFERPRSNHFSGFQRLQIIITSEIRTICPDFRRLLFPICLKTGRYVRFSDVCYFLSVWKPDVMSGFQTSGLKLSGLKHLKHWNRTSDNRTILSGYQTLSEIRTISQPDTFRKRRNPDVRFLDVYCIHIHTNTYTFQINTSVQE